MYKHIIYCLHILHLTSNKVTEVKISILIKFHKKYLYENNKNSFTYHISILILYVNNTVCVIECSNLHQKF